MFKVKSKKFRMDLRKNYFTQMVIAINAGEDGGDQYSHM